MVRKRKRKFGKIGKLCGGWLREFGIYSKVVDGILRRRRVRTLMARSPN